MRTTGSELRAEDDRRAGEGIQDPPQSELSSKVQQSQGESRARRKQAGFSPCLPGARSPYSMNRELGALTDCTALARAREGASKDPFVVQGEETIPLGQCKGEKKKKSKWGLVSFSSIF